MNRITSACKLLVQLRVLYCCIYYNIYCIDKTHGVPLCHLQKLYCGMRRALAPLKLFVKTSREEGVTKWVCFGQDGETAAVDLGDVPGPCGSKQLHLLPNGKEQPEVRHTIPNPYSPPPSPPPLRNIGYVRLLSAGALEVFPTWLLLPPSRKDWACFESNCFAGVGRIRHAISGIKGSTS
jgi:hypothetical protein